MPQLKSWLASSQDPSQVSNTVRGAILSFSAIIIFVIARLFNVTLSADDIISIATELGSLAGAMWFLYGLIFKGVIYAGSK